MNQCLYHLLSIADEPLLTVDSVSMSASTTPVSDTTASDTDQSGLQHQATDREVQMEDTPYAKSAWFNIIGYSFPPSYNTNSHSMQLLRH